MAILDGKIIKTSLNRKELILDAIASISDIEDKAIISIFTGKNVGSDEIDDLVNEISNKYDYIEVGNISGMQDIYDFIIGIN